MPQLPSDNFVQRIGSSALLCIVIVTLGFVAGCASNKSAPEQSREEISVASEEDIEVAPKTTKTGSSGEDDSSRSSMGDERTEAGDPRADQGVPPDGSVDSQSQDASATVSTSASASLPISQEDVASFRKLERSLGGKHGVSAAVVDGVDGSLQVVSAGGFTAGTAWSTSKVPIAMAAIQVGKNYSGRASDLKLALVNSDNEAAKRLWGSLGKPKQAGRAATNQVRLAGDSQTTIEHRRILPPYTEFGQTLWGLDDQVRFAAGLHCLKQGKKVLRIMQGSRKAQSWGLGSLPAASKARFKSGWGPGSTPGKSGGYLVRQLGVINAGGADIAVSIASAPSNGSFASGAENQTSIARWLVQTIEKNAAASASGSLAGSGNLVC